MENNDLFFDKTACGVSYLFELSCKANFGCCRRCAINAIIMSDEWHVYLQNVILFLLNFRTFKRQCWQNAENLSHMIHTFKLCSQLTNQTKYKQEAHLFSRRNIRQKVPVINSSSNESQEKILSLNCFELYAIVNELNTMLFWEHSFHIVFVDHFIRYNNKLKEWK